MPHHLAKLLSFGIAMTIFGMYSHTLFPENSANILKAIQQASLPTSDPLMSQLFLRLLNDSIRLFFVLCSGILFGVIPLLFLAMNAYLLGILLIGISLSGFPVAQFFLALLPSGVFNALAILLTTAYAMQLGRHFIQPRQVREPFFAIMTRVLREFNTKIVPLLCLSAIIDTFFTRNILSQFILHLSHF